MKVMTLILLVKDDQILLAQKKRGFGKGHWNGAGGKVEPGETIEQAMIRECQEEIMVTPRNYEQVARHTFEVHYNGAPETLEVHAFISDTWTGEPTETEEMRPQWFSKQDIPYKNMWQDDTYWLPRVLAGKKVVGHFTFDDQDKMLTHKIQEVDSL